MTDLPNTHTGNIFRLGLEPLEGDILDAEAFLAGPGVRASRVARDLGEAAISEGRMTISPQYQNLELPDCDRPVSFRLGNETYDILEDESRKVGIEAPTLLRVILRKEILEHARNTPGIYRLVGYRRSYQARKAFELANPKA